MLVRLVGVVLTVRQIGPASYGIFSAAAAFVVLVAAIAQMGIETYLIRQQDEPTRRDYDVAFTVLVWSSLLATAAALLLTYLVGAWIRPIGVLPELRVLLLSVPVNVLWAPAQAAIERRFRYRAMGLLELGSDVVLYGMAVPLAVLHAGAWSLVAGSLAMQAWLLLGGYLVAGFVPRLAWSSGLVARLLRHGFTFSLSLWAERLRGLVNPLVVGSFAGAAGVGYVAFAQRLVDTLGFARRGTYRLGMVAMGRVGSEQRARLRYAIEEGSALQLVALAVPLVGFGLLAARLVPLLFGHLWLRAVPLCVVLSIAAVLGALELVQSTFLFSRGENLAVAGANALSTAVLAGAAVLAVERWGVVGYGVASIASVASLAVVDRAVRRYVHFGYRRLIPLLGIVVPLLAAPLVPGSWRALVAVPLALGLCAPSLRGELAQLYDVVSSSLGRVPRRGAKGRAAGGSAVGAVR